MNQKSPGPIIDILIASEISELLRHRDKNPNRRPFLSATHWHLYCLLWAQWIEKSPRALYSFYCRVQYFCVGIRQVLSHLALCTHCASEKGVAPVIAPSVFHFFFACTAHFSYHSPCCTSNQRIFIFLPLCKRRWVHFWGVVFLRDGKIRL